MLRLRSGLLLMTMAMVAMAVPAAGDDSKAILLLHSVDHDGPDRFPFDTAFARTLRQRADVKVDLYIETLDFNRFGGEPPCAADARVVPARSTTGKKIAVVAVVWDEALAFLLDARNPLFPGVPVAALLLGRPPPQPERVAVIHVGNVVGQTIALALRLNPKTRQIAVIDGAQPGADGGNALNNEVQGQVDSLRLHVPVVSLHNLPLDELLPRVQRDAAGQDYLSRPTKCIGPHGEPIDHLNAVSAVARVAPGPLYVSTDDMIGAGALGGVVIPADGIATELAKLALRISKGGALPLPPAEATLVPTFDWREVRRWGVDERLFPPGSQLLFREPGVWDRSAWYDLGAVSLTLVQSVLIWGLLVQRARRRRYRACAA